MQNNYLERKINLTRVRRYYSMVIPDCLSSRVRLRSDEDGYCLLVKKGINV